MQSAGQPFWQPPHGLNGINACEDWLEFSVCPADDTYMRSVLLAVALLLTCSGCQQGPFPKVGRAAFLEHWFPVAHTYEPRGLNTHSRPPCPYFDPPPCNGAYAFCEECGVYHVVKTK